MHGKNPPVRASARRDAAWRGAVDTVRTEAVPDPRGNEDIPIPHVTEGSRGFALGVSIKIYQMTVSHA